MVETKLPYVVIRQSHLNCVMDAWMYLDGAAALQKFEEIVGEEELREKSDIVRLAYCDAYHDIRVVKREFDFTISLQRVDHPNIIIDL